MTASNMNLSPVGRILQAAQKYPDRPAIELHDASYTYRELTETAASIASSVNELDEQGPYIAIMADKSFSCYAGILGIMMAGKGYLPINPRFPAARNSYMLEKAKIRTIIAGDDSDDELDSVVENYHSGIYVIFPEGRTSQVTSQSLSLTPWPPFQLERGNRGQGVKGVRQNPAYLLFTSGTTGKPKGVPISNGNLSAYLGFMLKSYDFQPEDRFTQNFDLTFDLSVHDIFLAWSSGACLCVPQENSSFAMTGFIREKKPTIWFSVPSLVLLMDRMRLLKPDAFPSIRISFFCGEAFYLKTAAAWKRAVPQSRIVNLYGPTEATIAISHYDMPDDTEKWKSELGIISIGRIFDGNSALILQEDSQMTQQPDPGELCLTGEQVVDCYFENEQADHEAFFIEPESHIKYYKTGDLVNVDQDGDLFYLGRKDAEVKISGYRVNLKEIENVLSEHEEVEQTVVLYDQGTESQETILAYILGKKLENIGGKELDAFCRQRLPWYMVPGKYIFVKEMPLNLNGKVDVAALKSIYGKG